MKNFLQFYLRIMATQVQNRQNLHGDKKKSKDSFFNWEQFLQSESEFRKRGFKFMKGRFTANERFKPCLEDE